MSCHEVPLYQPANLRSWHEEMSPGQYALHFSQRAGTLPTCLVCDSLAEAERRARDEVERQSTLRCRIYDHQGFVGAPLAELTGAAFKGERDLSPRVRRWVGSIMLGFGVVLCALDWSTGFRLSWPALVGSRLLIPGFILLVTEALLHLNTYQKRQQRQKKEQK